MPSALAFSTVFQRDRQKTGEEPKADWLIFSYCPGSWGGESQSLVPDAPNQILALYVPPQKMVRVREGGGVRLASGLRPLMVVSGVNERRISSLTCKDDKIKSVKESEH